jgi:hypothetical protein
MKRLAGTFSISLLTLIALTACRSHVHPPEEVGTYEYHSGDIATGQSCFTLDRDGTYSLGNAGDPLGQLVLTDTPQSGKWSLHDGDSGQQLIIGNATLAIERTSSVIRVRVNDGLGIYCDLPQHTNPR